MADAANPGQWAIRTTQSGENSDITSAPFWQNLMTGAVSDTDPLSQASYAGPTRQNSDNYLEGQNAQGGWEQLLQFPGDKRLLQSASGGYSQGSGAPIQWKPQGDDWAGILFPMLARIAIMAPAALGAGGMEAAGETAGTASASGAGSFADLVAPTASTVPGSMPEAGSFADLVSPYSTSAATGSTGAAAGATAMGVFGEPSDLPTERLSPEGMQNDAAQFGTSAAPVSVSGAGSPSIFNMISSMLGGGGTSLISRAASALGIPSGVSNALGPMFNIGSGIYGMMQGDDMKKKMAQIAANADPFAQYRAGYGAQLQQLMSDPSSITSMPGYKAGLQAVERRGAAQGWNGSGNMMTALSDFGGNFYNQAIQNLMGLSGANVNPGTAASLAMQGNQAGASIAMQGLNRVGYGVTQKDPTSDMLMRLLLNRGA